MAAFISGLFGVEFFPPSSSTNDSWSSMPFLLEALHFFGFAIWFVSWFGLWKFRQWGRRAYTLSMGILVLVPWVEEPTLRTWQDVYFSGILSLVSGALLAMMWFSDVRHKFESPAPEGRAEPC